MTYALIMLLAGVLLLAAIVRLPAAGRWEERLAAWAACRKYASDDGRREVRLEEWQSLVNEREGFSALATASGFFLPVLAELAVNRVRQVFQRGLEFPRQASGLLPRIRRSLTLVRVQFGLTGIGAWRPGISLPGGQDRAFRLYVAGSSISMLGNRITMIAYPMLVLWLTRSPSVSGWVLFSAIAPSILVYLPAGALVDRWDARRTLILSETGRALAIATVAVMLALYRLSIPLLIMTAVIEQTMATFSALAGRRYVRALVESQRVPSAIASIEARTHVAVIASVPLGGLLFSIAPILPFVAASMSFIISINAILNISGRATVPVGARYLPGRRYKDIEQGIRKDITEGLRWLLKHKYARTATIFSSSATYIFQALRMVILVAGFAERVPPVDIGAVLAASGVGSLLGFLARSRLLVARMPMSMVKLQMMAWTGALAFAAINSRSLFCMAVVMISLGFTGALGNIEASAYILRHSGADTATGVHAIGLLTSLAACAVGPVLGGSLVQYYGVEHAILFLWLITAALALLSLLSPSLRHRRTLPPPAMPLQPADQVTAPVAA